MTDTELERIWSSRSEPTWWLALHRDGDGGEIGDRVECQFRFKGELAENAHPVEWEIEEAVLVAEVSAWRSQFGGEPLTRIRLARRIPARAEDTIHFEEGNLTMPARDLQG